MSIDPTDSLFRQRMPDSQAVMRFIANMIFDSFLKSVVREHCPLNPVHATLQVSRTDTILYVRGDGGMSFMSEVEQIRDWALSFIAGELFSLDTDDIDLIYLDGVVGSEEAYLHIAGKGLLISSGEPSRKGKYL